MSVVNVKVAHIRPQYKDLRDWMSHEDNVYIGRGGVVFVATSSGGKVRWPTNASKWCNKHKVSTIMSRDEAIALYEKDLDVLLKDGDNRVQFMQLRGKNLGCWCKPEKCHGDVILRKLDEMQQ